MEGTVLQRKTSALEFYLLPPGAGFPFARSPLPSPHTPPRFYFRAPEASPPKVPGEELWLNVTAGRAKLGARGDPGKDPARL